LPFALLGEL
jgi:hypothetical protein